jgi:hypothetical protein
MPFRTMIPYARIVPIGATPSEFYVSSIPTQDSFGEKRPFGIGVESTLPGYRLAAFLFSSSARISACFSRVMG